MPRPRDPALDTRILRATRQLTDEVGTTDLTIAAVAERAGVSRPTVYRRWRSKAALLFAAQTNASVEIDVPTDAPFREQLAAAVRHLVATMVAADRSVVGDQLAHMVSDRRFAHKVFSERWEPDREQVYALWERGLDAGEIDPTVDGRAVLDDIVAVCLYRVYIRHDVPDDAEIVRLVDRIVDGVRPDR